MEHGRGNVPYHTDSRQKAEDILYLNLTKCVVFVLVTAFVLYLPLGDPHSSQSDKNTGFGAVCCICDIYDMIIKAYRKILEVIHYILIVFKDALYDAKLRFYGLLQRLDQKDLCRNACAQEWEEDVIDTVDTSLRRRPRPICRCVKKKCCRAP